VGLGYNKKVLYPRPITLGKRCLQLFMGLAHLIKLVSFFIFNSYTYMGVITDQQHNAH